MHSIPGPPSTATLQLHLGDRASREEREGIQVEVFTPMVFLGCARRFTSHLSASSAVCVGVKAQGRPRTLPGLLSRYAQRLLTGSMELQAQKPRGPRQKAARDKEVAEGRAAAEALDALAGEVAEKLGLK